jgi:hypothetical protein
MIPIHIEAASERWERVEGLPETDLLRLAITRDLMHALHADKSRLLSQGQREQGVFFKGHEKRMDEIRSSSPLTGDLRDILSGTTKLKKRTRLIPEALFSSIAREKLERYDRQWEAALASEACTQGWLFWTFEVRLDIAKIDVWNKRLNDTIWPNGVVLFIESVTLENDAIWQGRWTLVLKPIFQRPDEFFPQFAQWEGAKGPVTWKLLFSPKDR